MAGSSFTVPKLQVITFTTILKRIWKCSKLSKACIDNTNKNNKLLTADAIHDIMRFHASILKSVQDAIVSFEFFPKLWRANLASAIEMMDYEIYSFSDELVSNLHHGSPENIEFCCRRVVITQEGQLDPRQTILNIMYYSQFKINFTSTLLAYYCIDNKTIQDLSKTLGNDAQIDNNHMEYVRGVTEKVLKVDQFWLVSWIRSQERASFTHSSLIQYVAANKILVALKYFYNYMDENEKKEQLVGAFKYLFHCNLIYPNTKRGRQNADILYFFYEHLDRELWNQVLERHFIEVFFSFMISWRHRDLCITIYDDLKYLLDIQTNKEILNFLLTYNELSVHDRYIIMTLVMKIWNLVPQIFREDPEVMSSILPDIVTFNDNFEIFSIILSAYGPEKRKEIITFVLLYLVARNKKKEIKECMDALVTYGIDVYTQYKLLNADLIKSFLLVYYCEKGRFDKAYCSVTNYAFRTHEERNAFKDSIFNDKEFIVKFLTYVCNNCDECLAQEFISWGFQDDREELKPQFQQRLITEYIPDVYRNVLTNVVLPRCSLRTLNGLCGFTKQQAFAYKLEIMSDQAVINSVLSNIIKCGDYVHFSKYNKMISEQSFTNFILSEECIQTVYDKLILDLDNIEEDVSLRLDIENLIDSFTSFKNDFLLLHDVLDQFNEKIEQYGHPNRRAQELKLKNRYKLRPNEMLIARQTVDAKYRIFKVIMHTIFLTVSLNNRDEMTLTELSMSMAHDAQIESEIVL